MSKLDYMDYITLPITTNLNTVDMYESVKQFKPFIYRKMDENPFIKKVKCKHCKGTGYIGEKKCVRCRGQGYWLKSLDENVYTICKSCRGTGTTNDSKYYGICLKCGGKKYKDWLEDIIPTQRLEVNKECEIDLKWDNNTNTELLMHFSEMTNAMIKEMAIKIEEEICNTYTNMKARTEK